MNKSRFQAIANVSMRLPINDESVSRRLDRAIDILKNEGYSIDNLGNGQYIIRKGSTSLLEDNSHQYNTTTKECSCPDYESARANLCKHRLAVMILEEMKG